MNIKLYILLVVCLILTTVVSGKGGKGGGRGGSGGNGGGGSSKPQIRGNYPDVLLTINMTQVNSKWSFEKDCSTITDCYNCTLNSCGWTSSNSSCGALQMEQYMPLFTSKMCKQYGPDI